MAKKMAGIVSAVSLLVVLAGGAVFAADSDEDLRFNRGVAEGIDNFRILRTDQKAQMNDYVTRVFELKNARAMEVIPYVRNVVTPEAGTVGTLKYTDPVTKKERNFIQVVCPQFQLAGIEQLITSFDLPGVTSSPGDTRYFYRMQHRNAADVNTVLRATELSGDGNSAVDAATNTIYFRDSASDFSRDLAVVRFMDVPTPQVELEVKIYEIDKNDTDKIGLYWDAWKHMLTGGIVMNDGSIPRRTATDGFQTLLGIGGPALAQFVNYLAEERLAKIVTNTRISAQNGQPAVISSLKRIPYQAYGVLQLPDVPVLGDTGWAQLQEQTAANQPGGPDRSDAWGTRLPHANQLTAATDPGTVTGEKSEGIYLAVTPTIGVKTLSAVITVTVNSLTGYTTTDMPIMAERRATTTATLVPGKVFTLGGMEKQTKVEEKRYIPLLSSIPVVGEYLFSYNSDEARETILVITIKPTVKNQMVYKSLSLGWGTASDTLKPDEVVFDLSGIVADNPGVETDVPALEAGFDAEEPELMWGSAEWATK